MAIEHISINNTDPWTEVDGERSSAKTKHPVNSIYNGQRFEDLWLDK
jgi:peptide/nickel transport system substrate-binding protein